MMYLSPSLFDEGGKSLDISALFEIIIAESMEVRKIMLETGGGELLLRGEYLGFYLAVHIRIQFLGAFRADTVAEGCFGM